METISQFFAENRVFLTSVGSLLLFFVPWLFVWQYKAKQQELLRNGRSAQAKILEIKASGVNLLLEVYPNSGQPYQVKTRDRLHLLDLSRIAPACW